MAKLKITQEEYKEKFNIMLQEVLFTVPARFDMLAEIIELIAKDKIAYWCATDQDLKNRGYEGDILQLLHLKVMKRVVVDFLMRKGDGQINNNPAGFIGWVTTLARTTKCDMADAVRGEDFGTSEMPEEISQHEEWDETILIEEPVDPIEQLKEAFRIVINANINIYKIISWLGVSVLMIAQEKTKIQATNILDSEYGRKTLSELFDVIVKVADEIEWLEFTSEEIKKIETALEQKNEDKTFGETPFEEFFMVNTKTEEKNGKKSISDWNYRLNHIVKKNIK